MNDVRGLAQSVLQTTHMERIADQQQRQAGVEQRALGHQHAQRVDQQRHQVKGPEAVVSDPLSAEDGGLGAAGDGSGEEEGQEAPSNEESDHAGSEGEPDLGRSVDLKA